MVAKNLLISISNDAEEKEEPSFIDQAVSLNYNSVDVNDDQMAEQTIESKVCPESSIDASILHKTITSHENDDDFNIIFNADSLAPPNVQRYVNPFYNGKLKHKNLQTKMDDQSLAFLNSEESQRKRLERAKKFGTLYTEEAISSFSPPKTDDRSMQSLCEYFEIDPASSTFARKVRFNAVHIRGVDGFSVQDVFDYFDDYKPKFLEWINDTSCNLVWEQRAEAAAAILGLSKPIRLINDENLPEPKSVFKSSTKLESPLKRANVEKLLQKLDPDGDQIMDDDEELENLNDEEPVAFPKPETSSNQEKYDNDTIDIDSSRFVIPVGYIWRVGDNRLPDSIYDDPSRLILMRFATVDDFNSKKSFKTYEKHSRFSRSYNGRGRNLESYNFGTYSRPACNDLRSRLRDQARWEEIKGSSRRWTDEEDTFDCDESPYSDLDEPERCVDGKRSLRMQMRADDVERKIVRRSEQSKAALFYPSSYETHGRHMKKKVANVVRDREWSTTWPSEHDDRDDNDYDDGLQNTSQIRQRINSRSPIDIRERLKKYRMRITVDNTR